MTRDETVAELQTLLGYRTDKVAEITRVMGFMQNELELQVLLPWFLRTTKSDMVTIAHNELMAPPTGFLREWGEKSMFVRLIDSGSSVAYWSDALQKDEEDYLRQSIRVNLIINNGEGVPQAYASDGTNFILFPTPDVAYTVRLKYYQADAAIASLTGGQTNKWLTNLPYYLVGRTGLRLAASTRDKGAMDACGVLVQEGLQRINDKNTSLEEAGARRVMGGED